eukprot:scaffold45951_cov23-Tisochrysis_lutea.AAC.1
MRAGALVAAAAAHTDQVTSLAWAPGGSSLVSGSRDGCMDMCAGPCARQYVLETWQGKVCLTCAKCMPGCMVKVLSVLQAEGGGSMASWHGSIVGRDRLEKKDCLHTHSCRASMRDLRSTEQNLSNV